MQGIGCPCGAEAKAQIAFLENFAEILERKGKDDEGKKCFKTDTVIYTERGNGSDYAAGTDGQRCGRRCGRNAGAAGVF